MFLGKFDLSSQENWTSVTFHPIARRMGKKNIFCADVPGPKAGTSVSRVGSQKIVFAERFWYSSGCPFLALLWKSEALLSARPKIRRTNHHYFSKKIAIHPQFVLQCTSNLYCSTSGAPMLWGKENTVSAPSHLYGNMRPICIAICLPCVSKCFWWINLGGCGHWDAPQKEGEWRWKTQETQNGWEEVQIGER